MNCHFNKRARKLEIDKCLELTNFNIKLLSNLFFICLKSVYTFIHCISTNPNPF